MACCTGQTKCNDTVTIGYLKSFIGSDILTTAGTPVSVSTARTDWRKDAYCPTYAELTGGTLIPNFVDGGTNKWASNVDGITINHGSSYSGNQVVKVEDLILTYTRYKSIAVSTSSTSLSECGGSTTLGRTFKLTKTIKAMNDCNGGVPSTSSSEGSDTAFTTTYSSTQGWLTINGNTATAPKNGTVSSSTLTTEVKASVNYKGATYTSTGVTVSQAALTGAYETTGTSTATGIDVTYTPTTRTFGCEGGTYTVEAVGKYYTRYKWKDSCGVVYNDVYNDVQGSSNLQTKTGTFAAVQCPIESSTSSSTASYSWSGITSNVTFTQNCSQSCGECEDYIVWGSGNGTATVPCEGGNVQVSANVSGVKHTKDYVEGVCQETGTATTSQTQSVTVVIPQNDTDSGKTYTGSEATSQGGTINYTITQPGGCSECTGAITTTEWSGQTVSAAACDTSKNLTLSGTSTTTYDNCSPKIESVISAVTVNFNENNTSNPTSYTFTFSNATVTVNQVAGPCKCLNPTDAYKFDDITVSCDSATSVTQSAKYTKYTNYSNCPTVSETGRTNVTIPAVSCNSGSSRVIQAGSSASTLASATPKITQDGGCECTVPVTCFCSGLTLSTSSVNWTYSSTTQQSVTVTKDACIGTVNVASNNAHFTASISGSNIRIQPTSTNTGITDISGVVTVSYTADTTPCTKTIDLLQGNSGSCNCANVVFTEKTTTIGSGATPSSGVVMASVSFGDCSGSLGSASVDTGSTSWLTASTSGTNVIIKASANTDLSNDRSGDVTVTYKANSSDVSYNCSSSFTVTQTSIPCGCEHVNKYVVPIKTEFGSGGTHNQKVLVASGDTHGCGTLSAGTISDMLSGGTFITEPIDGEHYDKVNIYAVVLSGWTGGQSGTDARTCGVTIIYTPKDGTPSCPTDVFSLRQVPGRVSSDDCDDFDVSLESKIIDNCNYGDSYISYGTTRGAVAFLTPKYDDVTPGSNLKLSGSVVSDTGYGTWFLTTYNVYGDVGRFGVGTLYDNVNDNYSARTVTFEVSLVKLRRDIHGDYIWETCKTFTDYHPSVTQSACSKYDCDCGDVNLDVAGLSSALSNLDPSSGSVDLDRYVTYVYTAGNFYCADPIYSAYTLNYSLDPLSASNYVHITSVEQYDGSYHQILTYDANDNDDRDYNLALSLSVNGRPCTEETISAHQRGLCSCSNFSLKIDGYGTYNHGEYPTITINDTQQDIVFEITGDTSLLSTCINGVNVSYFGGIPSWIHTKSTGTTSCTLTFDAFTSGSERTYGGIGIVVLNGGTPCVWNVTVTQTSCQCNPSVISNPTTEWSDVYSDAARFIKSYEITDSGECFSYQVSYDTSILNVISEESHYLEHHRINLSAATNSNWPSTLGNCEYTNITTTFYTNSEECSSHTFSVYAHKEPYCEYTTAGTLTDYQTTLTSSYDGSEIDIAEITGSNIMDNWCNDLSVTSQSMYDGNTGTVVSCRAVQENGKIMIKAKFHYVQNASPTIDINVNRTNDCSGSITHVKDWSIQVNMD